MISLLLCSVLAVSVQTEWPDRNTEGVEVLAESGKWQTVRQGFPLTLPTTTRSPEIARAARTRSGCAIRIGRSGGEIDLSEAESLAFFAIPHPADHRLVIADHLDGSRAEPVLLTPGILPARVNVWDDLRGSMDALPFVARLDGVVLERHAELIAPESIPADAVWAFAGGSSVLLADNAEDLKIAQHVDDQVFLTTVQPVPKRVPLEFLKYVIDGKQVDTLPSALPPKSDLEVWFATPPAAKDGETWTILVEADWKFQPSFTRIVEYGYEENTDSFVEDWDVPMLHFEGPDEQLDIQPTMGPGVAWGDVDGDGWVDLYLVQGGGRAGSDAVHNRLYRNDNGGFVDITESSGAGHTGAGMGALFFDADGDTDLDLYVANYGPDALFLNDGTGKFTDVSDAVGVGGDLWSASVCAADYDKDGDLDLYITSYLDYDLTKMPPAEELGLYQREDPIEMLPFAFPGQHNTFLRNDRVENPAEGAPGFKLVDVTEELGLLDEQGRGMQAVFWDFDADGDDDLYIANDVSFNVLFRNEGDGSFKDISFATGLDDPRGGMGLAVGDTDLDGDEDIFLTNWQLEANGLYMNNRLSPRDAKHRKSTFRDGTVRAGLGPAGIGVTSWGAVFFDAENDGDLDLFVANGYTSPDYESTGICVGQPNHFFENQGNGRFRDASQEAGSALQVELASRAAAACDYDQDGRVDLIVTANNGRPQLLHNQREKIGHWLGVRLRGKDGNTHAIGAVVTVATTELTQTRSLRAGTGYLSGNPPELHFGLGPEKLIAQVTVRWPSGKTTEHEIIGVDHYVTLSEQ